MKRLRLVAGLALCGALMLVFMVTFRGSLASAAGTGFMQTTTATPAAAILQTQASPNVTTGTITSTVSSDPADDLTAATVDLHAGYIMDPYLLPVVGKTEKAASEMREGLQRLRGCSAQRRRELVGQDGSTERLRLQRRRRRAGGPGPGRQLHLQRRRRPADRRSAGDASRTRRPARTRSTSARQTRTGRRSASWRLRRRNSTTPSLPRWT